MLYVYSQIYLHLSKKTTRYSIYNIIPDYLIYNCCPNLMVFDRFVEVLIIINMGPIRRMYMDFNKISHLKDMNIAIDVAVFRALIIMSTRYISTFITFVNFYLHNS